MTDRETIERLVIDILSEGEHEYQDLSAELVRIYKPTGALSQLKAIGSLDNALGSLTQNGLICWRDGHWESECFYRLTKKGIPPKYASGQKEMFHG